MSTELIAAGPLDVTVRAQFEQWYAGDMPKGLERTADGEYKYMPAQVAWGVWQAATAVEREACAKVCESLFDMNDDSCDEAEKCAAAIRMRSNA